MQTTSASCLGTPRCLHPVLLYSCPSCRCGCLSSAFLDGPCCCLIVNSTSCKFIYRSFCRCVLWCGDTHLFAQPEVVVTGLVSSIQQQLSKAWSRVSWTFGYDDGFGLETWLAGGMLHDNCSLSFHHTAVVGTQWYDSPGVMQDPHSRSSSSRPAPSQSFSSRLTLSQNRLGISPRLSSESLS